MVSEQAILDHIRRSVRHTIQERGYPTIEKFAHENGIDKSTVSRFLTGKRKPQFWTVFRIASALEISLDQLCGYTTQAPREHLNVAEKRSSKKPG